MVYIVRSGFSIYTKVLKTAVFGRYVDKGKWNANPRR